jgi:replication initiation protein RepC
LTGDEDLIVFPSNHLLSLRAHGMPASTLRRHLAVLVDAGLVVRRDSPNGKRYARKNDTGEIELAFGFDLSPLVVRSEEFESLAAAVESEARALKLVRERITLCRRDIAKMIATGIEEGVPTRRGGQGPADWQEVHAAFRAIVDQIPRTATQQQLEPFGNRFGRTNRDKKTIDAVFDQVAPASVRGSDDRYCLRHCFENNETETFMQRRHDKQIVARHFFEQLLMRKRRNPAVPLQN